RTVTARVVALAVAVAVASALVTGIALARTAGSANQEQAMATLQVQANLMAAAQSSPRAARLGDGEVLPAVRAMQTMLHDDAGVVCAVVAPGDAATTLPAPFTAADLQAVRAGRSPHARRGYDGRSWIVVGRAARSEAVLLAQPLDRAAQLTPAQRRRVLLGLGLGLLGGALAGLALGRTVTRPLARVAEAARRLSSGQRDVRVPPQGPLEVADVAQALNGLAHALTVSEQRQQAFLMNVSHELRTPLTAVTGYAEALCDGALPAAQVPSAAGVIRDEAARLQRRVEDLLALARMEADDFRVEPAPVDTGELLRAAAVACGPRVAAAGIRLEVRAPAAGPVAHADGERLRQAVDALVDNAIRVLPTGAPLVLATGADPSGWVRVEVRDGGPGLTPEDLAVAFERGRLNERYRGSRAVGSGLGLALVGELARRMGGRAEATAAPEGGACFALLLPPAPGPAVPVRLPATGG
ncbi:MAG TPA: HAMP domain-containing sensor histidine kinase, partial [Kineosporiaceae bacterium]|nr:HAMP domain-containing sensor histidine kinase [Kineosporiaceae bacterium]